MSLALRGSYGAKPPARMRHQVPRQQSGGAMHCLAPCMLFLAGHSSCHSPSSHLRQQRGRHALSCSVHAVPTEPYQLSQSLLPPCDSRWLLGQTIRYTGTSSAKLMGTRPQEQTKIAIAGTVARAHAYTQDKSSNYNAGTILMQIHGTLTRSEGRKTFQWGKLEGEHWQCTYQTLLTANTSYCHGSLNYTYQFSSLQLITKPHIPTHNPYT